jgi:hypothetical protein
MSDAEAIAAHIATKGVTRLPARGGGAKGPGIEAAIADPAGRLRMMLDCLPGRVKQAGAIATSIATYKNKPLADVPRRYVRKGYPFMAWVADDGVIWVRQEVEQKEGAL